MFTPPSGVALWPSIAPPEPRVPRAPPAPIVLDDDTPEQQTVLDETEVGEVLATVLDLSQEAPVAPTALDTVEAVTSVAPTALDGSEEPPLASMLGEASGRLVPPTVLDEDGGEPPGELLGITILDDDGAGRLYGPPAQAAAPALARVSTPSAPEAPPAQGPVTAVSAAGPAAEAPLMPRSASAAVSRPMPPPAAPAASQLEALGVAAAAAPAASPVPSATATSTEATQQQPSVPMDDDGAATCLVCMLPLLDGDVCALSCGHVYHTECFHRWLVNKPSGECPQCKQLCTREQLRTLEFEVAEVPFTSLDEVLRLEAMPRNEQSDWEQTWAEEAREVANELQAVELELEQLQAGAREKKRLRLNVIVPGLQELDNRAVEALEEYKLRHVACSELQMELDTMTSTQQRRMPIREVRDTDTDLQDEKRQLRSMRHGDRLKQLHDELVMKRQQEADTRQALAERNKAVEDVESKIKRQQQDVRLRKRLAARPEELSQPQRQLHRQLSNSSAGPQSQRQLQRQHSLNSVVSQATAAVSGTAASLASSAHAANGIAEARDRGEVAAGDGAGGAASGTLAEARDRGEVAARTAAGSSVSAAAAAAPVPAARAGMGATSGRAAVAGGSGTFEQEDDDNLLMGARRKTPAARVGILGRPAGPGLGAAGAARQVSSTSSMQARGGSDGVVGRRKGGMQALFAAQRA